MGMASRAPEIRWGVQPNTVPVYEYFSKELEAHRYARRDTPLEVKWLKNQKRIRSLLISFIFISNDGKSFKDKRI